MESKRENTEHAFEVGELARRLVGLIQDYGPVAVAFSGGVDSAVVAKAAFAAHKDDAVAVTAKSPSLAASELAGARMVAEQIGIRHIELETSEFGRPEYQANAGDRCFFCKDTLYAATASQLRSLGVARMINGTNADDMQDHRPGLRAAAQHNVGSPLAESGITKVQVRALARYWHLTVADKPASPCLSSRIAYGVTVTEERVRRVEAAEDFLREQFGLAEFRVRCEADELARIEVPVARLPELVTGTARTRIANCFRELGFRRITLDMEGFRSGSLNDNLPLVSLQVNSE